MCKFDHKTKTTKPDVPLLISEVLMRFSHTSDQRRILISNYQSFIDQHGSDASFHLKLMQSVTRLVTNLGIVKKFDVAVQFLDEALVPAFADVKLAIGSEEVFLEVLGMFSFLSKYGHAEADVMNICSKLTMELQDVLISPDHKACNDLLHRVFNMSCKPSINETDLRALNAKHFKNAKVHQLQQKTAAIIAKLFAQKISSFDLTPDCFTTFHSLAVGLFHVFKNIKNAEGLVSCCEDAKRHEVHSLNGTIISFAHKMAANGNFNPSVGKALLYHVNYDAQICKEFKCEGKSIEMLSTYNRLYNVLYEFNINKAMVPDNISFIHEYVKALFKLWNQIPAEVKASSIEPDVLAMRIYEAPETEEGAMFSANGMASLMAVLMKKPADDPKQAKRLQVKNLFLMRTATKLLGFPTATEFMKSKQYKDPGFTGDGYKISLPEFIHLEMAAMFRYIPTEDIELVGKLFIELSGLTSDRMVLAQSCQTITDATLKTMDIEKFRSINKRLDKEAFDVDISLALALNNYSIYFVMYEEVSNELKQDAANAMDKLDLRKELEHLKYLNESLRHFTDVVCHLMKNKDDLHKVQSMKRVLGIVNNMAIQYFLKGIKYKDLEAYTLLWNLSMVDGQPSTSSLMNVATFFLDHHELLTDSSRNYVKISKKMKPLTVEEILLKLNKLLDETSIPAFETQPEATQCYILSYLLSLWVYNLASGRKAEGFKRFNQFKTLWAKLTIPEGAVNREAILAKLHFSVVEIEMICCNRSSDKFLSLANGILMKVKSIDREFIYQFYQIYHRITIKAINYSINRLSDMNHYDVVMASLILMASKKGHCLKVLDLLSLSILRYLNMEKIEHAKVRKSIERMLIEMIFKSEN